MRLKSLEIVGFKSFAQPVRLEFGPGVTAVVGPNGSGKSNLADALRWVLGEQSSRELRLERMEDLIFHGSAGRRAVGLARVTLTLDNSDGTLPLPQSEVSITRLLDRSGLSEYRLNRVPCRLRDITELLWGSGLGRNSYAFVGQGEVDRLVFSRPGERRLLVEEAAGVTRIRARRQEAERHLERARQASERVRDLVHELELQRDPLREAAARAEAWAALEAERRSLVRALFLVRERRVEAATARAGEELALLQEESGQAASEVARAEQELAEAGREEAEAREPRMRLERQAAAEGARWSAAVDAWLHRLREAERAAQEAREAREAARPGRQPGAREIEGRAQALAAERRAAEEEAARREEAAREAAAALEVAERELRQAEEDVAAREAEWRRGWERLQALRGRAEAERAGRMERLEAARARRRQLERELAEAEAELANRLGAEKEAAERLEAERRRWREGRAELERLRRRREQAGEEWTRAREEFRARRQRLELLRGMEEAEAGYPSGVRAVLQGRTRGDPVFRAVVGPLGELLEVEPRLAVALEVALGGQAYHLVVESGQAAQQAVEALRRAGAGRATFLPLDGLRPRRPSPQELPAAREAGALGWAAQLCRYEPRLAPAVEYALGRVLIAEELSQARRIALRYGLRFPVVTLAGDQVHAGGAISGGSRSNRNPGPLERRAETARLEAELAAEADRLRRLEAEARAILAEQEESERRQAAREASLREAEIEAARAEERAEQARARLAELRRDAQSAAGPAGEEAAAGAGEAGPEPAAGAAERELAEAEARLAAAEEARRLAEERLRGARGRQEAAASTLQEARLAWEQARSRATQLARELAWTTDEALRLERLARERIERARQAEARAESLAQEAAALLAGLARQAWRVEWLEAGAAALAERQASARARAEAAERALEQARRRSEQAAQRLQAARLRLARLEAEAESVRREAAAAGLGAEWAEEAEPPAESEAALEARRQKVEEELLRMGPVHSGAPAQLASLEARLGYLAGQLEDLERSRGNLEKLLHDLDQEGERRFRQALEEVRRAFGEIFVRLFQGGEAGLRLTDEEEGEPGIEIEVRLPGKRRAPLSLLSGGERALTAVAFLLALEQVRPSPFAVLDEVDAALDETSVARLAGFLKEQGRRLQILVITHQRATMEAADRLWGVTSAERGVSQLFHVELAEAAGD
ncbi:MAG: chromosome segregation protein SMC [Bacillota bacterium]|nr:chromosome segregation protein SMC [Bacillota bacterium]